MAQISLERQHMIILVPLFHLVVMGVLWRLEHQVTTEMDRCLDMLGFTEILMEHGLK